MGRGDAAWGLPVPTQASQQGASRRDRTPRAPLRWLQGQKCCKKGLACVCACVYTCVCIHVCAYMCVCMCVHVCVRVHACMTGASISVCSRLPAQHQSQEQPGLGYSSCKAVLGHFKCLVKIQALVTLPRCVSPLPELCALVPTLAWKNKPPPALLGAAPSAGVSLPTPCQGVLWI